MRGSDNAAGYPALRERALALLARRGPVDEAALLEHVYGAAIPPALRPRLAAPLAADPRLATGEDGRWRIASQESGDGLALAGLAFTALAVTASGPRAAAGKLLAVAAVHVAGGRTVGTFSARLRPARRVARYALALAGAEAEAFESEPAFREVAPQLVDFLGTRPVFAQQASLAWSHLARSARGAGQPLPACPLVDVNLLADTVLELPGKPTLARICRACGLGDPSLARPEDEARAVAATVEPLLRRAQELGVRSLEQLRERIEAARPERRLLRDTATARALPDDAGVYVLRDDRHAPLYVGKGRRLRERLSAYVSRPLGPTRRLEGLAEAAASVDVRTCATDLEALVLENQQIRALQPKFNTQRALRETRLWLRLSESPQAAKGGRTPAPPRILLRPRAAADGARYLGPFASARAAARARSLARQLFELDAARRSLPLERYRQQLDLAWKFLAGGREPGIRAAQAGLARASQRGDFAAQRRWRRLLAAAQAYDLASLILPGDPREARLAVVRRSSGEVEALLLDHAVLVAAASAPLGQEDRLVEVLLAEEHPRTEPDDIEVVLRWLGTLRSDARIAWLSPDRRAAAGALGSAIAAVAATMRERQAGASRPNEE